MRKVLIIAVAALVAATTAFAGTSYVLSSATPADITLSESGCIDASFTLPPTREPQITLRNTSSEPMVFTIPKIAQWVSVPAHGTAPFDLPRYIMGNFTAFCMTEAEHEALNGGGSNHFLCSLQPEEIAPYALNSVAFTIATHDRIHELLEKVR